MRDKLIQEISKQFKKLLTGFTKDLKLKYVEAQGYGDWTTIKHLPQQKLEELRDLLKKRTDVKKKLIDLNNNASLDNYYEMTTDKPKSVGEMRWKFKDTQP